MASRVALDKALCPGPLTIARGAGQTRRGIIAGSGDGPRFGTVNAMIQPADDAAWPADGLCVVHATVDPDWLDYNDHMNVACYLKAFDDASEQLTCVIGMGAAYTRATGNSWVALESHLGFLQEARQGDALRIETRVIDVEGRKLHLAQEMYRDGTLLATHEQLGLHFDTTARRGSPFPPDVLTVLLRLREAQATLPQLRWLGRTIGLHQPKP